MNYEDVIEKLEAISIKLKSYDDYPDAASNNAKRVLKWVEKNGWGGCLTNVGKRRANMLAKKMPISRDTIARMASFKRHQKNKDVPYSEGCGGLAWDAWGGSAGVNWAISKLKEIDNVVSWKGNVTKALWVVYSAIIGVIIKLLFWN